MAKQSPAQRLFTLTCCLLAAPRLGLSKQEIYDSVQAYADSSDEARERRCSSATNLRFVKWVSR